MAANLQRRCLRPTEPGKIAAGFTDSCGGRGLRVRSARGQGRKAMGIGIREIIIILVVGIGFIIWLARRKD
ncbi:MAG TPA: hypothetical protein VFZ95_02200 [Steroidobacteraceae bacterium]